METTTDTKSMIIIFDRANAQLQNDMFQKLPPLADLHGWADWDTLHFVVQKLTMAKWQQQHETQAMFHCWNAPPPPRHLTAPTPLSGLHKHSASTYERQQVQFFLHGGIQLHTFNQTLCPSWRAAEKAGMQLLGGCGVMVDWEILRQDIGSLVY